MKALQRQFPAAILNVLRMSSCDCSSIPCTIMSPGLLTVSEIVTTGVDERTCVVIRFMIVFLKMEASSRRLLVVTVAPASICLLDSGCRPGLPNVTLPVKAVVKFAPSSVAVGARKPVEAPTRNVSQSSARIDDPRDCVVNW